MSIKNTPLIPKVSFKYDTLDSTNAAAIRDINAGLGADAGAVYWTEEQSAGRGQGSNRWHTTPSANLTISLVAYPDHLTADRLFALSQLTGLAIAETVKYFVGNKLAPSVKVKWPNDVYVGSQKIAGVLVQNGLRGRNVSWSVIGIGLNVQETNFPPELQTSATSLELLTGQRDERTTVAAYLFHNLSTIYQLTFPEKGNALNDYYLQNLYLKDETAKFRRTTDGSTFTGIIRGIDRNGRLQMDTAAGVEYFSVGEVKFL